MFDPIKFGQEMGLAIRAAIDPLVKRIVELEGALAEKPDHSKAISDQVAAAVAMLPKAKDGADGKDVDMVKVRAMLDELVKALPKAKDGAPGADGQAGPAGKDADMDAINSTLKSLGDEIRADIANAMKAIPAPKDGKDGAAGKDVDMVAVKAQIDEYLKDIRSVVLEELGAAVKALPAPKDGAAGRDGADGKSFTVDDVSSVMDAALAKWALEFERRASDKLDKAIERIPVPKDGANGADGKDGRDGFGFEDISVESDGSKTFTIKFQRGDIKKEFNFSLPVVIDKGVYREDGAYLAGDGCTWAGSYWIAQKDSPEGKPDAANSGWRLAVKRGRDGKDGRNGIDKVGPFPTGGAK